MPFGKELDDKVLTLEQIAAIEFDVVNGFASWKEAWTALKQSHEALYWKFLALEVDAWGE